MKPSYVDELEHLVSSYVWAAHEDVSPLAELLDVVVSGTALYIGSGGALAVSALASALHVAKTGRLATDGPPLAVSACRLSLHQAPASHSKEWRLELPDLMQRTPVLYPIVGLHLSP
jgi:hypothetical protein